MKRIAACSPPALQRGFTLIELMVTIFIAAILLSIAIPSFRNMLASNRLATVTNEFITIVNTARSAAISRNKPMTLCATANSTSKICSGGGSNTAWSEWIIRDSDDNVIQRGRLGTQGNNPRLTTTLAITSPNPPIPNAIAFAPNGTTTFTGGAVFDNDDSGSNLARVCSSVLSNDNIRRIRIGVAGNITTFKATGACQ